MSNSTHVVFFDAHATPEHDNDRADWLGKLIHDIKPDVVVCGGDSADMSSLCSYDKGKRAAIGRSYFADIASHNEFQDRVWAPYRRSKRRRPYRVALIGNHEQRIEKAIDQWPELENTIGLGDLQLDHYYDDVVEYAGTTPGTITVDGICYSHYITSGAMGRPIGGQHHAYSLLSKCHASSTVGHSHVFDYSVQSKRDGSKIMGLSCPAFLDYNPAWVGDGARSWSSGVVVKRGVDNGRYDLEVISIERLKEIYG